LGIIVGVSSVFEFRVTRTWKAGVAARPFRVKKLIFLAVCAACLAGCATQQTMSGAVPKATSKASASAKTISARSNFARPHPTRTRFAGRRSTANASIPLPGPALLERQPSPDCEFRGTPTGNAGEDARMRLDYQQQCYRHAEGIVRTRLDTLQDSVGETVRAIKRR
jgi:hypothetical protein